LCADDDKQTEDVMTEGEEKTGSHHDWPDESHDELDPSAPVGDRLWVPEDVLAIDGKRVTMKWIDENGLEHTEEHYFQSVPELWKETARGREDDLGG
jgi:hypothetical protein